MQEDYADDPGNRGIRTMDEAAMDAFVRSCKELDRPVVFHAIGDQAIRQILDVFARYAGCRKYASLGHFARADY